MYPARGNTPSIWACQDSQSVTLGLIDIALSGHGVWKLVSEFPLIFNTIKGPGQEIILALIYELINLFGFIYIDKVLCSQFRERLDTEP